MLLAGLAVALLAHVALAQECTIPPEEKARILNLPYSQFDQSMGAGWRAYSDRGCYLPTARLIDEYLRRHQSLMEPWQIRVVIWHAGQLYASGNDYSTARIRFLASLNPDEPKDTPILWNDYVNASVAFLDGDVAELTRRRDRIAAGPEFNGAKVNLNILDSMIRCFGKPYAKACSNHCDP